MPKTLNRTREAFVSAVKAGNRRDSLLNVVVVRLLAVALMVTQGRTNRSQTGGLIVPDGYRAWPAVDSEANSFGMQRRLRFHVCPKAAAVAGDERFPVGTVLVVETSLHKGPAVGIDNVEGTTGWTLSSVFVMGKYASMHARGNASGQHDGWGYATYDSDGFLLAADSTSCGVCRLPVM